MKKYLLGALYLAIPIFGWFAFARSFKRVGPGEISTIQDLDGNITLIEEGLYFEPSPGKQFGETFRKEQDFIDFGALKRVRVREGQLGVKTNEHGVYEQLNPGIHIIETSKNETFDKTNGLQDINKDDFMLGNKRHITIRNGELGESYQDGNFVLLTPGQHILDTTHQRFVKKVSVVNDIVDLGAHKIITVKEGQVAFVNTPNGVETKGPGKHEIRQEDGLFFDRIITTGAQGMTLPTLTVMCSDQIEMKAKSMLIFSVTEPLRTVALGLDNITKTLMEYADATLRSILSRFSSFDIAPTLNTDADHDCSKRVQKLSEIHDTLVSTLNAKAAVWGLSVSDLQITEILPADEVYHENMRKIGTQQSTASINKMMAETAADIAKINASAEESRVTAAEIEQREALVRAETDAQTKKIQAKADADAEIARATGSAEAKNITSQADANRITILNSATNDATETTRLILNFEAYGKVLENVKNPVFVQPDLGNTRIFSNDKNGMTMFSTNKNEGSNFQDIAALQVMSNIAAKGL
jgi:regulator of protease activity HflC (stomatin/prohibitin superfamily)